MISLEKRVMFLFGRFLKSRFFQLSRFVLMKLCFGSVPNVVFAWKCASGESRLSFSLGIEFRENPVCRFCSELNFGKIPNVVFAQNRALGKSRLLFPLVNVLRENPVRCFQPEMGFGRIPFIVSAWKCVSGKSSFVLQSGNRFLTDFKYSFELKSCFFESRICFSS